LDLENSNDNASSSEFDDYVGNFDHTVNDQGVQIDCEKMQQDDDETQGKFGLNEDGHWHRLVPSDQQDDELKVTSSQLYTKYILNKIRCFVFLKRFIY
jgi:hypothetical protein